MCVCVRVCVRVCMWVGVCVWGCVYGRERVCVRTRILWPVFVCCVFVRVCLWVWVLCKRVYLRKWTKMSLIVRKQANGSFSFPWHLWSTRHERRYQRILVCTTHGRKWRLFFLNCFFHHLNFSNYKRLLFVLQMLRF